MLWRPRLESVWISTAAYRSSSPRAVRLTFPLSSGGEGLKVGKRYQDEDSGIEVLVTKPGAVTLQCDGKDMALQEPKKTKSAD